MGCLSEKEGQPLEDKMFSYNDTDSFGNNLYRLLCSNCFTDKDSYQFDEPEPGKAAVIKDDINDKNSAGGKNTYRN